MGREAMVRLNSQPAKFDGIRLENCGLVFLSTPHSGTTQADWNDFLVNVSELTIGVRSHEIVEELRSFNPSSVDSGEAFDTMRVKPPFHCFCEAEKTTLFGKHRIVISPPLRLSCAYFVLDSVASVCRLLWAYCRQNSECGSSQNQQV